MSDTPPQTETVTFTLNGQTVEAEKGELVIAAAERAGVFIPHFCYHPRMKPVGMCRMCIVDIDSGRGPALQPSCMIEVSPAMVVHTESEGTKKAQNSPVVAKRLGAASVGPRPPARLTAQKSSARPASASWSSTASCPTPPTPKCRRVRGWHGTIKRI